MFATVPFRPSRRANLAYTGLVTPGGAGLYGVVQLLVGAGTEIHMSHVLAGSNAMIQVLAAPLITSGEAALTPTIFAPAGYAVKCTISQGYTTAAPPNGQFRFGFDLLFPEQLVARAGQYLCFQNVAANQQAQMGAIVQEREVGEPTFEP